MLDWQEPELKAAGVEIPDGYDGSKKSFTLSSMTDGNRLPIGVLCLGMNSACHVQSCKLISSCLQSDWCLMT